MSIFTCRTMVTLGQFGKTGSEPKKIRLIEENAKCRHKKKLPVKGERRGATVYKAGSKIPT